MAAFKRNIVKPNIFDYNLAIFGQQGTGKTTLAYEVCNKLLPDQYVIFNCGKEDGIKALNNAIYFDAPTWGDLEDMIDDIVDNRTEDETYRNLKLVVLDTIDEIFTMAEREIIRRSNKDNPTKPAKTINQAYSGYGAGLEKTVELVLETLWKLKSVGINVFYIGHVKNRSLVDIVSGQEYETITSNLSTKYFSAIATKMDVIGICYIDRDVIKSKGDRKDINGKVIEKSIVANEARKICFRSDDYIMTSKSRFPNIASVVDLNADDFIKAIEDAIQSQIDKSGHTKEELIENSKKESEAHMEKVAAAEASNKAQKEISTVVVEIITFMKDNRTTKPDALKAIMALCKENGISNPQNITDMDLAQKVLELCK